MEKSCNAIWVKIWWYSELKCPASEMCTTTTVDGKGKTRVKMESLYQTMNGFCFRIIIAKSFPQLF